MEKWKKIKGYSNYMVSNESRVKSLGHYQYWYRWGKKLRRFHKGKILKPIKTKIGYSQVGLTNDEGISKCFHIHRLVVKAFIPNLKNKPQVNHKDGDKTNNNLSNLEWVTLSEQMHHAYDILGIIPYGLGKFGRESNKARAVIQKDLNGKIIKKWFSGMDAVREGGFDSGCICHCCKGEILSHKGFKWEYGN